MRVMVIMLALAVVIFKIHDDGNEMYNGEEEDDDDYNGNEQYRSKKLYIQ